MKRAKGNSLQPIVAQSQVVAHPFPQALNIVIPPLPAFQALSVGGPGKGIANKPKSSKPSFGGKGKPATSGQKSTQVVVACPFCVTYGKKQQYVHPFPLNCPLLKGDNRMHPRDVRKIVADKRLCFNCFDAHPTKGCTAPNFIACPIRDCKKRHSVYFHPNIDQIFQDKQQSLNARPLASITLGDFVAGSK
jgi:hypothetical protein